VLEELLESISGGKSSSEEERIIHDMVKPEWNRLSSRGWINQVNQWERKCTDAVHGNCIDMVG
jgi:hypothetical protein